MALKSVNYEILCIFENWNKINKKENMNKRIIILSIICNLGSALYAQTLTEAKQLFNDGKYEEALPAFQKLVKQSPANANYNYWYGACCYETGQTEEALGYLKKAADRSVVDALPYLAETQAKLYLYDAAVESMNKYITRQQKKKANTDEAEARLERMKIGARMLKGTEQVTIIDSFVVDKSTFLTAYKVGQEAGVMDTYNHYFNTEALQGSILYQTELGNRIYYAKPDGDSLSLCSQDRLADSWEEATLLQGLNTDGNQNYPYVLSDGVTLYYASDGSGSIGGYDIFVTRYNSETNRYLRPENVGMPFNSPYNDYMYVIDEYNNLGWFASDRYQPEDKVCVYVFVPNESRVTYDYENTDEAIVRSTAKIESIAATWKDSDVVRSAKQRLMMVIYQQPDKQQKHDFEFVIDDNSTYYTINDFKSPQAKRLFQQWQQSQNEYTTLSQSLETKRDLYHRSNANKRQSLSSELLTLERDTEKLEADLTEMEVNIRNVEKNYISK